MLESRWFALAGVGFLFLLCWLFIYPRKRVYLSSGLAGVLFGICTLAAPGVEKMTQTGTVVAAPIDPSIQFVTAVLAILSLFVVYARRLGKWPPESDPEATQKP